MYNCTHFDCAYRCTFTDTCDYLLITGFRRESPAASCRGYEKKLRPCQATGGDLDSAADEALMEELYHSGLTDREIAAELGLSPVAVGAWRRQEGLPAQRKLLYA